MTTTTNSAPDDLSGRIDRYLPVAKIISQRKELYGGETNEREGASSNSDEGSSRRTGEARSSRLPDMANRLAVGTRRDADSAGNGGPSTGDRESREDVRFEREASVFVVVEQVTDDETRNVAAFSSFGDAVAYASTTKYARVETLDLLRKVETL